MERKEKVDGIDKAGRYIEDGCRTGREEARSENRQDSGRGDRSEGVDEARGEKREGNEEEVKWNRKEVGS